MTQSTASHDFLNILNIGGAGRGGGGGGMPKGPADGGRQEATCPVSHLLLGRGEEG